MLSGMQTLSVAAHTRDVCLWPSAIQGDDVSTGSAVRVSVSHRPGRIIYKVQSLHSKFLHADLRISHERYPLLLERPPSADSALRNQV